MQPSESVPEGRTNVNEAMRVVLLMGGDVPEDTAQETFAAPVTVGDDDDFANSAKRIVVDGVRQVADAARTEHSLEVVRIDVHP